MLWWSIMHDTNLSKLPTKQLAGLAQVIVLICLAALFFRLRVWESSVHRSDFEAMTALSTLVELSTHNLLIGAPDSGSFETSFNRAIQKDLITWLQSNHK
jgi:hypothetical protein